jgi:hypothetical protein
VGVFSFTKYLFVMDKKIISEITRQYELMNIQEQPNFKDMLLKGIFDALMKDTVGFDFSEIEKFKDHPQFDDIMKSIGDQKPLTTKTSDDDFYKKVLEGIGAPVTPENMKFLYAWRQAEGGKAKNNPFNTTQSKPNSTFYNCLKKGISGCVAGVRNYATEQDGIDATIKTLKNGRYTNIINALKKGDSAQNVAMALKNSPWGTGELALKVVRGYDSGSSPKPPTIA